MTQFTGIYTALITPFANGKVDEKAFQNFVEWQIQEGVHGLVPCGTTGESPTLSYDEHKRVIELTVEVAKGRVPVMAGTGSNSTDEAIMFTAHAKKAGAEAALVVAPYYNKPTQEGLYQHFKAINDAVELPIFIYNIPGRSVVNISDETLVRLSALPNVAGVKDATGDLTRPLMLRSKGGKKLQLFSGEDMTAVAFNVSGGQGCISVLSNVMPKQAAAVQNASLKGEHAQALALLEPMVPLIDALFAETSPAPVKYALSLMNKANPDLRLPLVLPKEETCVKLRAVLSSLNLI
jgi:4-hydroxy-tetrahydrodipicolinate synthase